MKYSIESDEIKDGPSSISPHYTPLPHTFPSKFLNQAPCQHPITKINSAVSLLCGWTCV